MIKRVVLFLATNVAIIAVISILLSLFNISPYLTQQGLNYETLFIYALIIGFTGSIISLLVSKPIAKHTFRIQMIQTPKTEIEFWLIKTTERLATRMSIGIPEVGIYESPEANAFATGWNKNKALMAISTGMLNVMDKEELEGVIGHELSHIANGDMVTMTLIQGVVNTFVIFFARIAAYLLTQFLHKHSERGQTGFAYYGIAIVFEMVFGLFATMIIMWFSRHREFRADSGSAQYVGKDNMIKALQKLKELYELPRDKRAPSFVTMKISDGKKLLGLFASHPPLDARIAALRHGARTD